MRARCWLATALVGAMVSLAAPAWAAMSADQVAAAIAEAYGVTVLRIEPMTKDGRAAYLVTIMNPGGDLNDAFQVNKIIVDAETGNLIGRIRHLPGRHRPFGGSTAFGGRAP